MEMVLEELDEKCKEEISGTEITELRNKMMELRKDGLKLSLLMVGKGKHNSDENKELSE